MIFQRQYLEKEDFVVWYAYRLIGQDTRSEQSSYSYAECFKRPMNEDTKNMIIIKNISSEVSNVTLDAYIFNSTARKSEATRKSKTQGINI